MSDLAQDLETTKKLLLERESQRQSDMETFLHFSHLFLLKLRNITTPL